MTGLLDDLLSRWAWAPGTVLAISILVSGLTMAAVLVDRRSRSASAVSWVLLCLIAPFLGPAVYWVFGRPWLSNRRARSYVVIEDARLESRRREEAKGDAGLRRSTRDAVFARLSRDQRHIATQAASISHDFPLGGNRIELFAEAADLFARMAADIDAAVRHVHIEFYIVLDDETSRQVFEALERTARRGIPCRLLVDGIGSRIFLKGRRCEELRAAGVTVVESLPVNLLRRRLSRIDLRNHRKIVVVDGAVGYIGSHNLASRDFKVKEKYAPWIDATMRVVGPVANDLQKIFVEDWYLDTDENLTTAVAQGVHDHASPAIAQVLGTGPATYESAMPQMVLSLVHAAEEEVVLTTPYFVPDEPALAALLTAARRGVRTVLILPARNDSVLVELASRKYFQRLLEAGVELWQYHGGLLHSKTIVVDRQTCLMTSANLDRRSFELNLEVSMVVYDEAVSVELRRLQDDYLARSTRIDPRDWWNRPAWKRLVENGIGLLSPIL